MMITNVEPVIYIAWEFSNKWQLLGIDISKAAQIHCLPDQHELNQTDRDLSLIPVVISGFDRGSVTQL